MATDVLRELFVVLGVKTEEASFVKASLKVEAIKGALHAVVRVAEAAGRALVGAFESTAKQGADMLDLSKRTGVSTEALQAWRYAAELNGATAHDVAAGMRGLANNMQAASMGSAQQVAAFQKLGVSVKGADGKLRPMNDVLLDIADKFSGMPDGTEKTALAMDTIGRAGVALIPMLDEGGQKLAEMAEKARRFGLVMDKDTMRGADALDDAMTDLNMAMEGLRNTITGPLLKPLAEILDAFNEWVAANRQLIASRIHTVVRALGTAFGIAWRLARPFLDGLWQVVSSRAFVISALVAMGAGALGLAGYFSMVAVSALASVPALLASAGAAVAVAAPFLAIGAAVVGTLAVLGLLVEDLYAFAKGENSLTGFVLDNLKGWFTHAIDFWKQQLLGFIAWIAEKFEALPGPLKTALAISPVGGAVRGAAMLADWVGGPSVPASSNSVASNIRSTVNVYASPNMSPADVGNAVVGAQSREWAGQLDDAYAWTAGG